jgi:hypothetical protein
VRSPRITRKLALLVALLATGALACQPQPPQAGRVLMIGIDGASLGVIEPMIREGKLPNLAAIAEAGASGKLRSLTPLLSPRVWTSVATGRTPSEHGIKGWIEIPKGDREGMRIYDSHDREVHALWNIFSRSDRSVAIVNWLMTYPPEPVNGVMITDSLYPEEVFAKRQLSSLYAKSAGGVAAGALRVERADHVAGGRGGARHRGATSGAAAPARRAVRLPRRRVHGALEVTRHDAVS